MTATSATEPKRFAGWFPEAVLVVSAGAIVVNWILLVDAGFQGDPIMTGADVVAWVAAFVVRRTRPDLPVSLWLMLMFLPFPSLTEAVLDRLLHTGGGATQLAWANLAGIVAAAFGVCAGFYAIGLYPDGRAETPAERRLARVAWLFVLPPVVVAFASSQIPFEYYVDAPEIDNPLHVLPFTLPRELAGGAVVSLSAIVTGLWLLLRRYRRSDVATRRRIRVLLVPLTMLVGAVVTAVVFQERVQLLTWILVVVAVYCFSPALAIGILQPTGLNVDIVVRRMWIYGVLWLAVSVAFVAAGTVVGVTAGAYLPIEWSVAVALVAAMLFQPARTRLETLADRWVFGQRTDPGKVIERLGETLALAYDLDTLLSRMVAALEDGLGIAWARVRLPGAEVDVAGDPAVSIPITLDGQQLGVVECGPKTRGAWTDADHRVVTTFASHAALALHNVKLTEELSIRLDEIAASRARLVRAQETERRRIERNIHDGVQQDLVALVGLAGHIRNGAAPGIADDLVAMQEGLTHVHNELRDLAKGIHPSLLSDQGVLIAVEALAARHPIPVEVRADANLRGKTFAAEAEGAIYFAVAEALTNTLKHSCAEHIEVTLARRNGSLITSIHDDGTGFDRRDQRLGGSGLAGLNDRISALGGRLEVDSAPGCGTTVRVEVALGEAAR